MFHLVGRDRLEKVKTAVCQPRTMPDKCSAFRRDTIRFSLENKLTRREKDLFSACDLILRLKLGKEIDAGVPKKSRRVADARDAPRPLSTRDAGREAQPPQ